MSSVTRKIQRSNLRKKVTRKELVEFTSLAFAAQKRRDRQFVWYRRAWRAFARWIVRP